MRDRNGRRLASRLAALPGLHPQKRPPECTRHSHHLFMLRIDPPQFGASRNAVRDALEAEGIPCSAGYGYSLPDQPIFRNKAFGPFLPQASGRLDYRSSRCPNSDLICREQGLWLGQNLLLGSDDDVDDIVRAFEKVYASRDELKA
jgi:dTDP-4-amino-4,6-dideoxygalactose transaminase